MSFTSFIQDHAKTVSVISLLFLIAFMYMAIYPSQISSTNTTEVQYAGYGLSAVALIFLCMGIYRIMK